MHSESVFFFDIPVKNSANSYNVHKDDRFFFFPASPLQADYYTCIATIVYLRKENCLYQACPSQDCNKKVVDQQNGMFRCEKCDKEFPNFKYRLILSVSR